jgi:hypothetical protein
MTIKCKWASYLPHNLPSWHPQALPQNDKVLFWAHVHTPRNIRVYVFSGAIPADFAAVGVGLLVYFASCGTKTPANHNLHTSKMKKNTSRLITLELRQF